MIATCLGRDGVDIKGVDRGLLYHDFLFSYLSGVLKRVLVWVILVPMRHLVCLYLLLLQELS